MGSDENRLPRELVPGLQWIGACYAMDYRGEILHTYDSLFLVAGEDASMLIEGGLPLDVDVVLDQLERALEGKPPLKYIFLTHEETPHAGGVGILLENYPDAVAIGDVRNFHLYFPGLAERFRKTEIGEVIDLGGKTFTGIEPAIKDLHSTQWGLVPECNAIFTADGFAFAHYHRAGQCGKLAHEVEDLDIAGMSGLFVEQALNWQRFVDPEPFIEALRDLLDEHAVTTVCPTHGLPVTDVEAAMPDIYAGLRMGRSFDE